MPWTVYNSDGQILQGSSTLADDAVTTAKILNANVTLAKMAANSIDSDQYVDASIDNAHLADDAVDSDEIAAGAIDLAHMSVNSIDSDQYVDGSIDTVHIGNDQITGAKLNPSLVLGDIIYADGTDTIARLAKGSADEVLTMGGSNAPTWAAASAGAVTREGGNTTEATTTSYTATDLLSITSLTPDITENLICIAQIRNTAPGAGADSAVGLKINSTINMEADITRSSLAQVGVRWATGADTIARAGSSFLLLGPQVTNYLSGVQSGYTSNQVSGGASAQSSWSRAQNFSADMPGAAITSVIYRAEGEDVTNPDPTIGIDEVHVYSLAVS